MILAVGVEDVGIATLITALVTLFGVAVRLLTNAAGVASTRFEAEISRLQTDKDEQIESLRSQLTEAHRERDLWYRRATGQERSPDTGGTP